MADLGANVSHLELISNLTGLTHDIFVGDVRDLVRRESPTAYCMKEAPAGFFKWSGQQTKFAVDNLGELLASGEGSFEDIGRRIQRHLWNSWKNMEIRQSVCDSTGLVAK